MALVVGELVGYIRLEDQGVQPALQRTQAALQATGANMAQIADHAGQAAGQALGDGTEEGARSGLTGVTAVARREGDQAGQALGAGLADGAADGADDAEEAAESGFSRIKTAALGVGVAAGAVLVSGMNQALSQSKITAQLGAQLGTTPAVAQKYGKVAGALFAAGVTEDFEGAAEAIKAIVKAGLAPPDATNAQLQSIATKASDVATSFDQELGGVTNAVAQLMRTGLAKNADEAFDIITKGLGSNANKADDFLDTINEYSTQFRRLGLDGETATGLISQGLQGGARDADQVADAIGQFGELTLSNSTTVQAAFKSIGLNSNTMAKQIGQGGTQAQKALGQTLDALRGTTNQTTKLNAATALFGDPGTVMGNALYSLDPASAAAAAGMDKAKGATDKLGKAARDNAAGALTQFKNSAQQGLVNVLGTYAVPAIMKVLPVLQSLARYVENNSGVMKVLAGVVGGVLIPVLVLMGVNATVAATRTVAGWVTSGASALTSAATQVAAGVRVVAGWIAQGAAAAVQAARVVAGWVLMGAQALIQGARMAAAWLLAMGPIPLIIAAIVGLVALIVANWSSIWSWTTQVWGWIWGKLQEVGQLILSFFLNWTLVGIIIKHWSSIKSGTLSIWNSVVAWLKGVPGMILGFFLKWTLLGTILRNWDAIKSGTISRATSMANWVRGLPGMIVRGLGNLEVLLYNKGQDVVSGLWNGIKSMGAWLRSTLMGWARNLIPGPIAKALGIGSPSKVMAKEVGQWIPAGVVKGIQAGSPALDKTMSNLVDPAAAGGGSYGGGSMAYGGRRAAGPPVQVVIKADGSRAGAALVDAMRYEVGTRGGNVQSTLGR